MKVQIALGTSRDSGRYLDEDSNRRRVRVLDLELLTRLPRKFLAAAVVLGTVHLFFPVRA